MPQNVTQYDLLVSCPGDIKEELLIIEEIVSQFNEMYSDVLQIAIRLRYWSKSAYPQSGDKPQTLLNKQFVNDCDAAVAIFWTRFGTPTDTYESGTEEEIEIMLEAGKQVFLYFSELPISPGSVDDAQYKKIKEFKERYSNKGLYFSYGQLEDFSKLFKAHLNKYFLSLDVVKESQKIRNQLSEIEARMPDLNFTLKSEENLHFTFTHTELLIREELSYDDISQDLISDLEAQDEMVVANSELFSKFFSKQTSSTQEDGCQAAKIGAEKIDYRKQIMEEIAEYNAALPSQQEFDVYNAKNIHYINMTKNRHKVNVFVENSGTTSANQVTVTLRFPKNLLVFDDYDIEKTEEPKKLEIPKNPLYDRHDIMFSKISKTLAQAIALDHGFSNHSIPKISAALFSRSLSRAANNYYIEGADYLCYKREKLLHTQAGKSHDFFIVATKKGTYEIEGEIICEELSKPIKKSFVVIVE